MMAEFTLVGCSPKCSGAIWMGVGVAMCVCACACACVCMCVYECACVCVRACGMCVYICEDGAIFSSFILRRFHQPSAVGLHQAASNATIGSLMVHQLLEVA